MPKNLRKSKYQRHLHILVSDEMYNFVKFELNGGICSHVRSMISNTQKIYNKEITNLEKEIADNEAHLVIAKRRLEDLKAAQKQLDDQQKTKENIIKTAKIKLFEIFKNNYYDIDLISNHAFNTYSELTGMSISELKLWLKEHQRSGV